MNEFVRVCERRKFQVHVDKGKVMRCSRFVSVGRMDARQDEVPLEKLDCSK